MAKKQIRIGLIDYGFMGRAHSNAFAKVGHFFDSGHELVMQAVCGRSLHPRVATHLSFLDAQGQPMDYGLAMFFPAPHSYTG